MFNTILSYIRKTPRREKWMLIFCKYIPYPTAIGYLGIFIYLVFTQDQRILFFVIRPASVFIVVTFFRKVMNRPRPYDTLQIEPLFKHKKGESFPSRHTASAFIIALVCFTITPMFGSFLLVIASLVAITRVIAGVHYISDVIIAISIAYMGWWI